MRKRPLLSRCDESNEATVGSSCFDVVKVVIVVTLPHEGGMWGRGEGKAGARPRCWCDSPGSLRDGNLKRREAEQHFFPPAAYPYPLTR